VRGNFITDSGGIGVVDERDVLIEDNTIHGGGIQLFNGYANTIRANRIDGAYVGIEVSGQDADGNVVEGNEVTDSRYGVFLSEAYRTQVTDNLIRRSGTGITLDYGSYGSFDNLIARNRVLRSEGEGIVLMSPVNRTTSGNQLIHNTVRLSRTDGIAIHPEADGATVEQNVSSRNGDDGIDVDSSDTTITRNRADRNGDLGIEAVDGVTDGGGNRAKHNGNPAQCIGVRCR
jgi:parallel beta-helix repeat protein